MKKTINIKPRALFIKNQEEKDRKIESWINPQVPIKRLNLFIPSDMHSKIKNICAEHNIYMTNFVSEALKEKIDSFK